MTDLNPADWREVTLDVATLTLGEAAEAERQSGLTIQQIAKGRATLKLLAMFVHGLRHSAKPPSWQELGSLRFLDVSLSTSQESRAGTSEPSKG